MTTSKKNSATKKSASTKSTKKSAAKKSVKSESVVRNFLDRAAKIVLLVKENPRRKGTFGYKSFSKMKNGMTVEKFTESGGRLKDLHWDINHGYVKVQGGGKKAA